MSLRPPVPGRYVYAIRETKSTISLGPASAWLVDRVVSREPTGLRLDEVIHPVGEMFCHRTHLLLTATSILQLETQSQICPGASVTHGKEISQIVRYEPPLQMGGPPWEVGARRRQEALVRYLHGRGARIRVDTCITERGRWSGAGFTDLEVWIVESAIRERRDCDKIETWYAPRIGTWVYRRRVSDYTAPRFPGRPATRRHAEQLVLELTAGPFGVDSEPGTYDVGAPGCTDRP